MELTQSADGPTNVCTVSEQNFETRESVEIETRESVDIDTNIPSETLEQRVLERDEANIGTHSPIEHFRSPSLSPIEDQGSFYRLLPDYGTKKNVIEIRCLEESIASKTDVCFVELPVALADQKREMVTENVTMTDDLELDLSRCTLHSVEEQNFLGTDITCLPQEVLVCPGINSGQQNNFAPDTLQQPYLNDTLAKNRGSRVSQSSIPVWVSELKEKAACK